MLLFISDLTMRAIVIITIAAFALTANGAPLTDITTSNDYEDQFLFILKLICPNTKVVYVNEDGTGKNIITITIYLFTHIITYRWE